MKKKLVQMLAAMLSVCCLAGCRGADAPIEPVSQSVQESTNVEESTLEAEKKEDATASEGEAFAGVEVSDANSEAAQFTDGTYDIQVESSSSMFKIEKAQLTVEGDKMSAVITLSGTGYGKLFMGTAEAAAAADEADCITFVEDENGAYTYTLLVAALDQPIDCAAFSNKKEEWYDRQLTFLSASISTGAEREASSAASLEVSESVTAEVAEGTYTIDVTLGGGSGKSTVISPATLTVTDTGMVACIEWSSPNYDYMLVNEEKYLPVNTEGNSVFEIPVAQLDTEFDVIGDTVAMSKPHEIEYTLTFHSDTIEVIE